ncbi:hypothetical protein [Thermococcus waiotapuensis]|uniref:Uncharacterized protein n=1 Tax=Thermococcus waiotapuensis TaxID=90909 RepID=A0AAE4NT76_9EURY|nr:hypothetical protein [Thermococcus waiotapuensis]MDV3103195.1 hypothetical protein [Thermococcus waiotapuensis]
MRVATKSPAIKEALLSEFKGKGISFETRERQSYEAFVGYAIEGTLEEIRAKIEAMESVEKEEILKGFNAFKENLDHLSDHLKEGEKVDEILAEGPWVAEVLDQLFRAGALEYSNGTVKLRDGFDVSSVRFHFKFPFELVHDPEKAERVAKQFVFTDLVEEYEFEIGELDISRINELAQIIGRYFPEEQVLKLYFGLIGRAILSSELLRVIGEQKIEEDVLKTMFLQAMPMEIPTERGTLVINASREFLEDLLRFLEKKGYIDRKAGKVKKLRDL